MHRFLVKIRNLDGTIDKHEKEVDLLDEGEEKEKLKKKILVIAQERVDVAEQMNRYVDSRMNEFKGALEKDDCIDMIEDFDGHREEFIFTLKKEPKSPLASNDKTSPGTVIVDGATDLDICYCKTNKNDDLVECSNILVS